MWRKKKAENSGEEAYDEGPDIYFFPQKHKRPSKEEQIYGIFGSTEEQPEIQIKGIGQSLAFVRSKKESELKVSGQLKIIAGESFTENISDAPEATQFKETEKKPQFMKSKNKFPGEFGMKPTNEALEEARTTKKAKQEELAYKKQYGKGYNILKSIGFDPNEATGKTGKGIVEPIIPQKRPEKLGLNFGGYKERSADEKAQESVVFMNVKEETQKAKRWKIDGAQKVKRQIKREEKQKMRSEFNAYKREMDTMQIGKGKTLEIYDMTKPQVTIINGSQRLNETDKKHVLRMKSYVKFYLDQCRNAKRVLSSEVEEAKNNLATYKYEAETLDKDISLTKKELEDYKEFIGLYDEVSKRWQKPEFNEIFEGFKRLFKANSGLYKECDLPELSAKLILNKTKRVLLKWRVSEDNTHCLAMMRSIQDFFKETIPQPYGEEEDEMLARCNISSEENTLQKFMVYFLLVLEESWIPIVVSFVNNEWDPKEPEMLIKFCNDWQEIVPREVMLLLYETSVAPRIYSAVQAWNPFTDTLPIHIWIHPWLPILDLNTLRPSIEAFVERVMVALKDWEPQDSSAMILLKPWKPFVANKMWSNLTRRCIIPKLMYAIKELEINPASQKIGPLKQLFEWLDLVDTIDVIQIMKDFFFPKWLDVLDKWIKKGPNKKELYAWYTGWKEFIPKVIGEDPSIRKYFAEALKLLQQFLKSS